MTSTAQIKNSPVVTKTTVVIDSKFRTTGTINNFTFDLGTTITDIKLVEILSVDFVNILNNVNENNNRLNWVDSLGVTHADEVTTGNYTILSLVSEIGVVMNLSNTGNDFLLATADLDTSTITISSSESDPFDLKFGVTPSESIGPILGFGITNYLGIGSQSGPEMLALYPTKHIFVGSTILTKDATDQILLSNGITNIAYVSNVDGIFSEILHNDSVRDIKLDIPGIKVIDIRLFDDNGGLLVIPDNVNEEKGTFVITLDIYAGIFDLTYYKC